MVDLQSTVMLSAIKVKNGGSGTGVKEFSLWVATSLEEEWVVLITAEMANDEKQVSLNL